MTLEAAPIDLRSDTVTRPSSGMRAAMAAAEVGDDQYGEDPTVNRLQEHVAGLLGKPAALWLPSGTMANQIGLRVLTHPGDDVIVSRESHTVWHEAGASAANAGVQFTDVGARGVFTAEDVLVARKPRGHVVYPPTTLIVIENTHNRAGGVVFPQAEVARIAAVASEHQLAMFLDGARLWNAVIAASLTPAEAAAPFDLVTVAFSKGLGAPAGSMLAGSKEKITAAVRYRRMYGGAMRQVGILAAAALYALDRNLERLVEDHVNARRMAEHLAEVKQIAIDPKTVETNIVIFQLEKGAPDAATVVARAAERGVLVFAFGPRTIRAVTHLDVTRDQCERAAQVLGAIASGKG